MGATFFYFMCGCEIYRSIGPQNMLDYPYVYAYIHTCVREDYDFAYSASGVLSRRYSAPCLARTEGKLEEETR